MKSAFVMDLSDRVTALEEKLRTHEKHFLKVMEHIRNLTRKLDAIAEAPTTKKEKKSSKNWTGNNI